jgi:uncharacterized protein
MYAFHLSLPVDDLEAALAFYVDLLGCERGRTGPDWADVNFHGHQLSLHEVHEALLDTRTCEVDGTQVPVRHFGLVLSPDVWRDVVDRLVGAGTTFVLTPRSRFVGQLGEQHTMFVADPAGNAIEFKAFPRGIWT